MSTVLNTSKETLSNSWYHLKEGTWKQEVDIRDFIQKNFKPYYGDDSFLTKSTAATRQLRDQVLELSRLERELGGVLKMDPIPYQLLYLMDPDFNKKLKKWSISKLNPLSIHCSLLAYFE